MKLPTTNAACFDRFELNTEEIKHVLVMDLRLEVRRQNQSNRHRQNEALKPYWRGDALFLYVKRGYNSKFLLGPQRRVRADSPGFFITVYNSSFFSLIVKQTTFIFSKLLIYYCNLERIN